MGAAYARLDVEAHRFHEDVTVGADQRDIVKADLLRLDDFAPAF